MTETPIANWSEHELEQRRAWLRLTHAQRFRWLEEAKAFASMSLEAAAARRRETSTPPTDRSKNEG